MVSTEVSWNVDDGRLAPMDLASVMVKVRSRLDGSELSGLWKDVTTKVLRAAAPWRTFRW